MRTLQEILKNSGYHEHEIELFLLHCSLDFIYFAEHVLGFDIAPYHVEWYELMEKFPRLSLQAYRGSGKTNWVAAYYVWKATFISNLNFLILSFNFEQSKLVLKLIRRMFVDNDLLKNFVPEGREATWKATELTVKTGCTFYSKTYGEGVRGLRIDFLFCDEAGLYEDKALFWKAVSPVVQLNRGKVIVLGTPTSHIDLFHELEENDEYYCTKYPAEKDGEVLWPQKYTLADKDENGRRSLKQVKKEIGELPYMQEYLLIPISSANSLYPYELTLKCLDKNVGFLAYGKINERYFIGVDLAVTTNGDYTVITVMHANNDGKRIVQAQRFRGSFEEQKMRLSKLYKDFKPVKICIDKTGCGEQIVKELMEAIPSIEPVHFTAEEKYKMLMDLRHEFENYNISIPGSKDDSNAYAHSTTLLKELNEFTIKLKLETGRLKFSSGAYDDTVISLALANKASISNSGIVSLSSF